MITETIGLLGLPATDKITGSTGVITSVVFDLYGCVQVTLTPKENKDKEIIPGYWFDVNRVTIGKDKKRVMPVPDFDGVKPPVPAKPDKYAKGAAEKRPL